MFNPILCSVDEQYVSQHLNITLWKLGCQKKLVAALDSLTEAPDFSIKWNLHCSEQKTAVIEAAMHSLHQYAEVYPHTHSVDSPLRSKNTDSTKATESCDNYGL